MTGSELITKAEVLAMINALDDRLSDLEGPPPAKFSRRVTVAGHSYAVTIPADVVEDLGIEKGTMVEVTVRLVK